MFYHALVSETRVVY